MRCCGASWPIKYGALFIAIWSVAASPAIGGDVSDARDVFGRFSKCTVERHGKTLGSMDSGDCFGETSYVRGARRTATIRAESAVSVLRVSSTLLEQVSAACQLRFNRVFLRALVARLQGNEPTAE